MARILVTKLGLDGHDVGVKVLATAARDAGHEVVYLGIRQTAQTIAKVALDEDVDVVAVSLLSGAHGVLLPRLVDEMREVGCEADIIAGGLIPGDDVPGLLGAGIAAVVESGVTATEAVRRIEAMLEHRTGDGPGRQALRA